MEDKRRNQIIKDVSTRLNAWQNDFEKVNNAKPFLEIIKWITKAISFGIVINSGRGNLCGYIGTHCNCKKLQRENPDSRIGMIGHFWYWIGYGNLEKINRLTENPLNNRNHMINTLEDSVEETIYAVGLTISNDNTFGDDNIVIGYIGSCGICRKLKKQYQGKIGRFGLCWHWVGKSTFKAVEQTANEYRATHKRYTKKQL